jgi:hypothetical protein
MRYISAVYPGPVHLECGFLDVASFEKAVKASGTAATGRLDANWPTGLLGA